MSQPDLEDEFDDDFEENDAVEADSDALLPKLHHSDKRRLIDSLLEEKRLAQTLKDPIDEEEDDL